MVEAVKKISKYADEPKDVKFRRVGERRMKVVLKQMKLLSNLFNRNTYNFSAEQANALLDALQSQIDGMRAKATAESSDEPEFKF